MDQTNFSSKFRLFRPFLPNVLVSITSWQNKMCEDVISEVLLPEEMIMKECVIKPGRFSSSVPRTAPLTSELQPSRKTCACMWYQDV